MCICIDLMRFDFAYRLVFCWRLTHSKRDDPPKSLLAFDVTLNQIEHQERSLRYERSSMNKVDDELIRDGVFIWSVNGYNRNGSK